MRASSGCQIEPNSKYVDRTIIALKMNSPKESVPAKKRKKMPNDIDNSSNPTKNTTKLMYMSPPNNTEPTPSNSNAALSKQAMKDMTNRKI
eukprot:1999362-Ditylum_brightwellii.AAC.1